MSLTWKSIPSNVRINCSLASESLFDRQDLRDHGRNIGYWCSIAHQLVSSKNVGRRQPGNIARKVVDLLHLNLVVPIRLQSKQPCVLSELSTQNEHVNTGWIMEGWWKAVVMCVRGTQTQDQYSFWLVVGPDHSPHLIALRLFVSASQTSTNLRVPWG